MTDARSRPLFLPGRAHAMPALVAFATACMLCAASARAQDAMPSLAAVGSVEPCLATHGERDMYRAGLEATGWVDVAPRSRPDALAMLADAFVPVTGLLDGSWATHMANRAAARTFWADLANNRTLMQREGWVLLLAGFRDDDGTLRVECWTAGPLSPVTDDFFALIGVIWQTEGVSISQVNLPATDTRPATELFVSRLTAPAPPDPPLAATDGLRTLIRIDLLKDAT